MFQLECDDGDIRLSGGATDWEGRVEICQRNSYLTVCDDLWDEPEAKVVCRQVNYTGEGLRKFTVIMDFQKTLCIICRCCGSKEQRVCC